jgi:acyl-CoA thioesterase-1
MRARALVATLLLMALTGCSGGFGSPTPSPLPRDPAPLSYVALGASETFGTGTQDPARDAFPVQLASLLGPGTILYNLGIPSETTQAALSDQLPFAVRVHAQVATVFFNLDDLVAGVPAADFRARLQRIVGALVRSGSRVLLAGMPPVAQLPIVARCAADPATCPLKGVRIPPPDEVERLVASYADAIRGVASASGATFVDLEAGAVTVAQHPEYVSADGFHPSTAGARALAAAFHAALKQPA